MIHYIIAAGIGALLGFKSKKSKKSYAKGGSTSENWRVEVPFGMRGANDEVALFNNTAKYFVRATNEDEASDEAVSEFYKEYDGNDYGYDERGISAELISKGVSTYAEGGEIIDKMYQVTFIPADADDEDDSSDFKEWEYVSASSEKEMIEKMGNATILDWKVVKEEVREVENWAQKYNREKLEKENKVVTNKAGDRVEVFSSPYIGRSSVYGVITEVDSEGLVSITLDDGNKVGFTKNRIDKLAFAKSFPYERWKPLFKRVEYAKGGELEIDNLFNPRTASHREIMAELNKAVDNNDKKSFVEIWIMLYNLDRDREISRIIMTGFPTKGDKDIEDVLWETAKEARENKVQTHFAKGGKTRKKRK